MDDANGKGKQASSSAGFSPVSAKVSNEPMLTKCELYKFSSPVYRHSGTYSEAGKRRRGEGYFIQYSTTGSIPVSRCLENITAAR
jgi:hypothetical protein